MYVCMLISRITYVHTFEIVDNVTGWRVMQSLVIARGSRNDDVIHTQA